MLSGMSGRKNTGKRGDEPPEGVDDLIAGMGRERMDLRARRTLVLGLRVASFVCLGVAGLSLGGYAPFAVAPIIVMSVTGAVGLVLSVLERPRR